MRAARCLAWTALASAAAAAALAACTDDGAIGTADAGAEGGPAWIDAAARDASAEATDGAGDAYDAGAAALCPSGTTLRAVRTACPGAPLAPPGALAAALAQAAAGDVVSLSGLSEGTAPCLPAVTCTPDDAPSMIFSDSPESPATDGVLYADTAQPGRHRIYVYHANGGATLRKFPVVVLNQGAAPAKVTIRRRGVGEPGAAYVKIGKDVLLAFSQTIAPVDVTVPAGQRVLLDPALDAKHASQAELVHAIYDVEVDAPVKVSVVSVPANADAAALAGGLSLLPRDGHVRGTFPGADVLVVPAPGAQQRGVQRLRLGANVTDDDLAGKDATLGTAEKLGGNYGVLYRVALALPTPAPAALSPRGGAWGGVARLPAATRLPASGAETLDVPTSAIALGTVGAGEISLATAGGSNLPVDLFLATP